MRSVKDMSLEELILLLENEEDRLTENPLDSVAKLKYNDLYQLILEKQNEKDHFSS